MLDNLFGDQERQDMATNAVLESYSYGKNAQSMADEVELPPLHRESFIGLRNQGATCYLNSFYQSLFMIPPIQKIFLELDLQELFGIGNHIS
jgi:ubiquitin C-terminal hydrolase